MADIRIKDLATTASTTASGDFMAVDGTTNGTRKLSATAPAFLTSVTTPSLTSPASTPLTLGTGTSGAAITVLSASNNVGIGTVTPTKKLDVAGSVEIGFDDAGANEVTKDFTTSHSPTNANASILFGLNDGGANGAAGVKISNSRVGAFNSQFISFLTSEGGVSVTTERMKIEKNGVVSIASTTAGSANAGALVVTGGGSFGNNGSASYFGGSVQIANAIISQSGNNAYITGSSTAGAFLNVQCGNATGGISFRDSNANNLAQYYQVTDAWSFFKPTTFSSAVTISSTGIHGIITGPSTAGAFLRSQSGNATGGIDFRDSGGNGVAQYYEATDAWSFFKPTTFSGAVTIGGNVGFYNASPVAKPTGVAVTAAAIHAALVTLNLIAA